MKGNLKGKLKKGLAAIIAAVMTFAMVIPSSVMTFAAYGDPDVVTCVATVDQSGTTVTKDSIADAIAAVNNGGTITVTGNINNAIALDINKDFTLDISGATVDPAAQVTTEEGHCLVAENGVYHYFAEHNYTSAGATLVSVNFPSTTANVVLYCNHNGVKHNTLVPGTVEGTIDPTTLKSGEYTAYIIPDEADFLNWIYDTNAFTGLSWKVPQGQFTDVYNVDGDTIDYVKEDGNKLAVLTDGKVVFKANYDKNLVLARDDDGAPIVINGTIKDKLDLTEAAWPAGDVDGYVVANGWDLAADVPATATALGTSTYKVEFTLPDNTTETFWVANVVDEATLAPTKVSIEAVQLQLTSDAGKSIWVGESATEFVIPVAADAYRGPYVEDDNNVRYYLLAADGSMKYRVIFESTDPERPIIEEAATIAPVARNNRNEQAESHSVCGYKKYVYNDVEVGYTDAAGNIRNAVFEVPTMELAGKHTYATKGKWAKQFVELNAATHDLIGTSYSTTSTVVDSEGRPTKLECKECSEEQLRMDTANIWLGQRVIDAHVSNQITPSKYYAIIPQLANHTFKKDSSGKDIVVTVDPTCRDYGFQYKICTAGAAGFEGFLQLTDTASYEFDTAKTAEYAGEYGSTHPVLVEGSVKAPVDHMYYVAVTETPVWATTNEEGLEYAGKNDDIMCEVTATCQYGKEDKEFVFHKITAAAYIKAHPGAVLDPGTTDQITMGPATHVFGKVIEESVVPGADCTKGNKITYTVDGIKKADASAISTVVTSKVEFGPHTYTNSVTFSANGKDATVVQECSKDCGNHVDKDGNKHTQTKEAKVDATDNANGSTTYTATLEGFELKNNTKTVFDLTKAVVTVNNGEAIDLNIFEEIPGQYCTGVLKSMTSVTINGVAIDEELWTINYPDNRYGDVDEFNLNPGKNNLLIVPAKNSNAVDSKKVVVDCVQPEVFEISQFLFDGMNPTAYYKSGADGQFYVEDGCAYVDYIEYNKDTTHTFAIVAKDQRTQTDQNATIKYAVSPTEINPLKAKYDLDAVELKDAGTYYIYASVSKEGFSPLKQLVAVIEIDPYETGETITIDKLAITYGEQVKATTGKPEVDEMIGLSTADSAKLNVGKYAFTDAVTWDHNYAVDIKGPGSLLYQYAREEGYGLWLLGLSDLFTITVEKRNAFINMSNYTKVYNGKAVDPVALGLAKVEGLVNDDDANLTISFVNLALGVKPVNAGKYTLKAVANNSNYNIEAATSTVTIKKAAQKFKSIKPLKKTYKAAKLAKKAQSFKVKAKLKKGNGKITFKKVSGNANVSITSGGKVVVKKGYYKSGTKLVIKVKVTAAATVNYAAKTVTKAITITVK